MMTRWVQTLAAGAVLLGAAPALRAQPSASTKDRGGPQEVRPAEAVVPRAVPVAPKAQAVDPTAPIIVQSPSVELFDRASALYKQKQYADALREFSSLAQSYPNSSRREEALFRIAECYRLLGRPQDALAAYQYTFMKYPEGLFVATAKLRAGDILYRQGDYASAVPLFEGAKTSKEPATKLAATYMLASAQLQVPGQAATGRTTLEKLLADVAAKPYHAGAAQGLAISEEKAGNYKAALAYWKKALALSDDPATRAMAAARGGWAALQIGDTKQAELLFGQARELAADGQWRMLANTGLVKLYYRDRRFDDLLALKKQEGGNFLESGREELLFATGHAYFQLQQWQPAIAAFDAYLKEYPKSKAAPSAAYERLLAGAQLNPRGIQTAAEAFLFHYGDSPLAPNVQLMLARQLSAEGDYTSALPVWQALYARTESGGAEAKELPRDMIVFELARALYESKNWDAAADAYGKFAGQFPDDKSALAAKVRQAIALQNAGKARSAAAAWEEVLAKAPAKGPERKMALEQLGLLYHQAGRNDEMARYFKQLLAEYPDSDIRAFAAYSVGEWAMNAKNYAEAEPFFAQARQADPGTWQLPASERLALLGFRLKDADKTQRYASEYELAAAATPNAPRLPAALYFWMGQQLAAKGQYGSAIIAFNKVVEHPDAGEFKIPAYWELGESQRRSREYRPAIASYETYRRLKPDLADSNQVLLALARAELGAEDYDGARELTEKVMLQTPEGRDNAEARALLGEIYYAQSRFAEAAKAFAALSLLYNDPKLTPRAMQRAAESYERAGDTEAAGQWRDNLRRKFPNYVPSS